MVPGQLRDHRHAYAAFVEIALDAAQRPRALEERGIAAPLLMRTVVADEHHQGVALDAARPQKIGEPADVAVHARNHRGKRRMRRRLRTIAERRVARGSRPSAARRPSGSRTAARETGRGRRPSNLPARAVRRAARCSSNTRRTDAYRLAAMNAAVILREEIVDVIAFEIGRGPLAVAPQMIGVLAVRVAMIEEAEGVVESLPIGHARSSQETRAPICRSRPCGTRRHAAPRRS